MEKVGPNRSIGSKQSYGFRKAFIRDGNIPLEARFLLILLMTYKGKNENCWPSQGTLGKDMNLSRDTVRKYLKVLSGAGHLKIKFRGIGRSLLYEPSYWKISAGKAGNGKEEGKPTEIPRHEPAENLGHRSISSGNKERECLKGRELFDKKRRELGLISNKARLNERV